MSKADDLIKSVTPEQLEKTRAEMHEEIKTQKEEPKREIEIETDARIDKLDLISDVQLITVGKFKNTIRLIWIMIIISLTVLTTQILQQARQLDMQSKMIIISESQREIVEEQKKATEEAKRNTEEVAKVKEEVKETKEQVKEAVESSPKLEIDPDSGKTKVIVPVKKPKTKEAKNRKMKDTIKSMPASLPTQVELRDEL